MKKKENIVGCTECGLILKKPDLDLTHQFQCPRCDAAIYRFGQNYNLVIMLVITSLVLFLPSFLLPLLTLKILDISQTTTLFETLIVFANDGYIILSIFIIFIGIFIPIIMLVLILLILIPLKNNGDPKKVSKYFKWYETLIEWQMAEVYLISIFVTIVKLQKMAEVKLEIGLYFFIAFLFFMFVSMIMFNPHDIWSKDEL